MAEKKTVVIVGLGFVGMRAVRELAGDKSFNIIAIDAKDFFENTTAAAESITDAENCERMMVDYTINPALTSIFKQGIVTSITANEIGLSSGEKIAFDYAILGTGSTYAAGIKTDPSALTSKSERVAALKSYSASIAAAPSVVIVGGGTVGVELAAAIAETFPGKSVTIIAGSGPRILDRFSEKVSEYATNWLEAKEVKIVTGERVADWGGMGELPAEGSVTTDAGTAYAGLVFKCLGGPPATAAFAASLEGKLTARGAVVVNDKLQVEGMPSVFAAGDVANTSEEKTANYADYAGMAAARNLKALATGKEMISFPAGLFKGAEKLPFASGATLGKKDGVMQMGSSEVTTGSSIGTMRSFFGKLIMGSAAGSWFWAALYSFIKKMFAGQIAKLAQA